MSTTISIEEAQAKLAEIIGRLAPGEEVIITRNDQPVARLVPQSSVSRQRRQPGSARGVLVINSEDEEHLKDFEEYMR